MKKRVSTKKVQIDSLKIMIDERKCQIIDETFQQEYIKAYIKEGETIIDEEINIDKSITRIKTNGTITIGTHEIPRTGKFITVTLSAKILGKKYFEGITKENIHIVWEEIMKLNIFKCSIETFKKSLVNDIDMCKNSYIKGEKEMDRLVNQMKKLAQENIRYINTWQKAENKGIEFNTRRGKTVTTNKPYVKIYHKGIELNNRVKGFKEEYLKEYDTENLIRTEATIKNGKHIKIYADKGIITKFRTLEELLNLSNKEKKNYIKYTIEQYIKNNTGIIKDKNIKETPMDTIIKEMIKIITKAELYGSNELIEILVENIRNENKNVQKTQKNRVRTKLKNLIKEARKNDEEFNEIISGEEVIKWYLKEMKIKL